ncbi:MAG: peptidase [Deltaproteobacteria bacterium]|nr:peptidase [Deltaproteobacteria bacterium]
MGNAGRRKPNPPSQAVQNFDLGLSVVKADPMFGPLAAAVSFRRSGTAPFPNEGYVTADSLGVVLFNERMLCPPEVWAYAVAHCLLHYGLGHFAKPRGNPEFWNIACDCYAARFLEQIKFGWRPDSIPSTMNLGVGSEESLYSRYLDSHVPFEHLSFGLNGRFPDMLDAGAPVAPPAWRPRGANDWPSIFAAGVAEALKEAVSIAGGWSDRHSEKTRKSNAARAKEWFVNSYPLLGALAAGFKLVEDPLVCRRLAVTVAAVDVSLQEIYLNPGMKLDFEECLFVMAHEMLHAGLRHDARSAGRDHFFWNVACDFVVNDWLVEMGIGRPPDMGILLDPTFRGLSAESVYDVVVQDMRRARKLATLRGTGLGDILWEKGPGWRASAEGAGLDEYYRGCLGQGLDYHERHGRGYLPAGLVEAIRALSHPPIPWDVELARWFDGHFSPVVRRRTYARISRRQSASPDIPRPNFVSGGAPEDSRTFGVLLDTSGSMDRRLLASCLGAIAGYSVSRDVLAVRVVFCDARAYDQGYLRPEDIAETVRVRGRGGTVLQPGIDLLNRAPDFPADAPLLIITDGECDALALRGREHAFLIPKGRRLPFAPAGPVFNMS